LGGNSRRGGGNGHFQALTTIELQHWPIVLMACRHYRIPVPPDLWIGLVDPQEAASDDAETALP